MAKALGGPKRGGWEALGAWGLQDLGDFPRDSEKATTSHRSHTVGSGRPCPDRLPSPPQSIQSIAPHLQAGSSRSLAPLYHLRVGQDPWRAEQRLYIYHLNHNSKSFSQTRLYEGKVHTFNRCLLGCRPPQAFQAGKLASGLHTSLSGMAWFHAVLSPESTAPPGCEGSSAQRHGNQPWSVSSTQRIGGTETQWQWPSHH